MGEPADHTPGLFASLKRLWGTLLAIGQNRLELLLVEWEEERRRAVEALLLALGMAVLALMTLIVGSFAMVILFWEDHRVAVLVSLAVGYLLGTLGLFWRLRLCLNKWQSFNATLAELKKDKEWLEQKD